MGFFKKIFKGVKKVFKKIGKGIKSAFKSIGKFMGKIGIIGQIGLALVLPGVGQILSGMLVGTGSTVGGLAGALQGMGAVGQAASSFIQGAVKVAGRVGNFFSTVTEGVTKVVGETVGAFANSLGVTPDSFIGKGLGKMNINVGDSNWSSVWETTQQAMRDTVAAGKNIFVPTVDPTQAAQLAAGQTAQVQEGLQGQIEGAMTSPEIPAPTMEGQSLLTPRDMTPPTGGVTSRPPTVLESVQAGSYTTDATGAIVRKTADPFGPVGTIDGVTYMSGPPPAAVAGGRTTAPITTGEPVYVAPETFTEKAMAKGKELYAEGVRLAQEEIAQAPARVVQAGTTKVMQAIGLENVPEYQYNQYAIAVPAIDMGSTTGIGDSFNTGQAQEYYNAYSADLQAKPYGDLSSLYAYFDFMRQQGYAS